MTPAQFKLPGTLAVIGGGRMGEAIIKGLLASGAASSESIIVADPSEERRMTLEAEYAVRCMDSAHSASSQGDIVVLAVKPQIMAEVVASLSDSVASALVVSIAAGITCSALEDMLPDGTAVVRVMPNTPAMVGEGMSVVSGGTKAGDDQVETVRAIFSVLGSAVVLDERHQDAATAISGSGPAYVAIFLDALACAGAEQGLPLDVSLDLALQTTKGTVRLLDETGMTPDELVAGVSSPGGTTVAATTRLDAEGFRQTIAAAVQAAVERAKELGS